MRVKKLPIKGKSSKPTLQISKSSGQIGATKLSDEFFRKCVTKCFPPKNVLPMLDVIGNKKIEVTPFSDSQRKHVCYKR